VVALALASGWFGVQLAGAIAVGSKVVWTGEELAGARALADRPVTVFSSRQEAVARALKVAGLTGLVGQAAAERLVVERDDGWRLALDPAAFGVGAPDAAGLLAAARCPVVLARGASDPMVSAEQLAGLVPGSRRRARCRAQRPRRGPCGGRRPPEALRLIARGRTSRRATPIGAAAAPVPPVSARAAWRRLGGRTANCTAAGLLGQRDQPGVVTASRTSTSALACCTMAWAPLPSAPRLRAALPAAALPEAALPAAALLTVAAGVAAAALVYTDQPLALWTPDAAVGAGFVLLGMSARRASPPTALLALAVAAAWWAAALWPAAVYAHRPVLVHLLLSFPGWWPRTAVARQWWS
jgi:hypothetical protein